MIPEVANHLIYSGGKRLRPMLTLATARLPAIAATATSTWPPQSIHAHRDAAPRRCRRRERISPRAPSARMLWGNEASVLVGDFLLGQAFRMMVEVGSLRALEILSTAAAVIAEGEVMQLGAAKNPETTEDEYLAVIRAKTAELFAAACEVGPAIAGRSKTSKRLAARLALTSASHSTRRRRARLRRQPPSSARTSATISATAKSRCL